MGYQESGIDRIMHNNYFNKTFTTLIALTYKVRYLSY